MSGSWSGFDEDLMARAGAARRAGIAVGPSGGALRLRGRLSRSRFVAAGTTCRMPGGRVATGGTQPGALPASARISAAARVAGGAVGRHARLPGGCRRHPARLRIERAQLPGGAGTGRSRRRGARRGVHLRRHAGIPAPLRGRRPRRGVRHGRHAARFAGVPGSGGDRRGPPAQGGIYHTDVPEPARLRRVAGSPRRGNRDHRALRRAGVGGRLLRRPELRPPRPAARHPLARRQRAHHLRGLVLQEHRSRHAARLRHRRTGPPGPNLRHQGHRRGEPVHGNGRASVCADRSGRPRRASPATGCGPSATRCMRRWRRTSATARAGPNPMAGCSCSCRCSTAPTRWHAAERAAARGVRFAPGTHTAADGVSGRDRMRLCYGWNRPDEMAPAIAELAAALQPEPALAVDQDPHPDQTASVTSRSSSRHAAYARDWSMSSRSR